MKKHKKTLGQVGRSTIEMIGVLTIMAILTIVGIAGYSKAMPKYKMSKLADQTALIIANIRAAYSIKDNYTGLDTNAAIEMGTIPVEMVKKGQNGTKLVFNVFGGRVFITPADDNKSVFITMAGLPTNACVYLASSDWGGQLGAGLISVASAVQEEEFGVGVQLEENIGFSENKTLPLTPVRAAPGCSGAGNSNAVIIQYH